MNAESKSHDPYAQKLDEYEQDIEDNMHLQTDLTPTEEAEHRALIKAAAMNSVTKNEHMTFRINVGLRAKLKNIAKHKGLKLHTLIHSVLYQYAQEHPKEAYE